MACPNADAVVRGDAEEAVEDVCRGVSLQEDGSVISALA